MNRLLALSIRTQLLLLAALVALPAAGIIVFSGLRLRAEAAERAGAATQRLADGIVAETRHLVAGAEQVVVVLAQLPEVRARDPRVVEILRRLLALNPAFSNVFIADRRGDVWASAVPTPGFNVADRRYFANAVRTGRLSSGEYIVSRATSRPAINLGYPLRDERGEVVGAVCVGLSLEPFRRLLSDAKLEGGANFVLLDHRGVILTRGVDEAQHVGKPYHADAFEEMREGPDAHTFVGLGLMRDRRIISTRKLRLPGEDEPFMYLRVGIPVATALRSANLALARNLALFLSFLALATGAVAWAGRRSMPTGWRRSRTPPAASPRATSACGSRRWCAAASWAGSARPSTRWRRGSPRESARTRGSRRSSSRRRRWSRWGASRAASPTTSTTC